MQNIQDRVFLIISSGRKEPVFKLHFLHSVDRNLNLHRYSHSTRTHLLLSNFSVLLKIFLSL